MNQSHLSPDTLVDYTRGELSARDDAAVHAHLAECLECASAHDTERHLIDMLKTHARHEEREMPLGLASAISARAASDREAHPRWSWHRFTESLRPVAAVAVAAVVALAFILTFMIPHGTARAGTIDASTFMANHAALSSTTPFEDGSDAPIALTAEEGQ